MSMADQALWKSESVIHDCAWAQAHHLLDLLDAQLPDECKRNLFPALYNISRAGIEAYCTQHSRLMRRIVPEKN